MKIKHLLLSSLATTGAIALGATAAKADTVTVKAGDTVSEIADTHKTTVAAVQKLNHLKNVNLIYVGDKLQVNKHQTVKMTRVADASKAAQPVIYLSMLAFFMALAFQNTPTNLFVKIFSYIPFFSSYFMPLRLINGMATMPAAIVSLLILIATIIGSMIYIGRIYGGLMLQTDELGFWGNLKRGLRLK